MRTEKWQKTIENRERPVGVTRKEWAAQKLAKAKKRGGKD